MDFQALLEKSGVLSSGGRAIEKDDEMGRAWRELEATQQRLGDARVAPKWTALGSWPPRSEVLGAHKGLRGRWAPGHLLSSCCAAVALRLRLRYAWPAPGALL